LEVAEFAAVKCNARFEPFSHGHVGRQRAIPCPTALCRGAARVQVTAAAALFYGMVSLPPFNVHHKGAEATRHQHQGYNVDGQRLGRVASNH
jgi:hypothetical protein